MADSVQWPRQSDCRICTSTFVEFYFYCNMTTLLQHTNCIFSCKWSGIGSVVFVALQM